MVLWSTLCRRSILKLNRRPLSSQVISMAHYYLDTSVAGLILDGELFSRAPEKMAAFMPELKFAGTKAELEAHGGADRIKLAYKWSREFLGGGGRLMITPTARVELISAPQFRRMEWVEDFSEVGLEEIHRLDLIVTATDVETALLRMLPELQAQINKASLSSQEEADLVPVLTLFNTANLISKHKPDFTLYMEACLAYSELGQGRFLVTDDHGFFKFFLQSPIAEETLHSVCARTLGITQGVRVKMAGEVIKGM